jgi:hypothetical protein
MKMNFWPVHPASVPAPPNRGSRPLPENKENSWKLQVVTMFFIYVSSASQVYQCTKFRGRKLFANFLQKIIFCFLLSLAFFFWLIYYPLNKYCAHSTYRGNCPDGSQFPSILLLGFWPLSVSHFELISRLPNSAFCLSHNSHLVFGPDFIFAKFLWERKTK